MRTVALPDDLFARLESQATQRGIGPEEFVVKAVQRELGASHSDAACVRLGHKEPFGAVVPAGRLNIPKMTNTEIFELIDLEDDLAKGRVVE